MKKYLLFFAISIALLLVHGVYAKHAIYGDGNGYYVTAQSIYYDHTLASPRILTHLRNFPGREYVFSRVFWDEDHNPYSVGTSLFWLPSLSIVSIFSSNPLDLAHEFGPGITGIICMLAGLYFLEQYLNNFYHKRAVNLTILSLFLGSNILYYSTLEPALSHQPAFFIIAFLLYATYRFKYSPLRLLALGLLFGLLTIVRIADTILLIPLFFSLKFDLKKLFYFGLGIVIALLPQLYAQYYYYGTIFRNFYVTEMATTWSLNLGHIYQYLFSYRRGLFIWSPIYLLGFVGLIKLKKKLMLFSILALWLVGSFWPAYSSAGFGQRLSISAVPFFGIGIAHIYDKLAPRYQYLLLALVVAWNIYLFYGFYGLNWKTLP